MVTKTICITQPLRMERLLSILRNIWEEVSVWLSEMFWIIQKAGVRRQWSRRWISGRKRWKIQINQVSVMDCGNGKLLIINIINFLLLMKRKGASYKTIHRSRCRPWRIDLLHNTSRSGFHGIVEVNIEGQEIHKTQLFEELFVSHFDCI